MNILGVGPEEIILVFIILFVVAGPKRMLSWAYQLGRYTAQFRRMFDETMTAVRKEFEEAQIDLPKDLRKPQVGRFNIVEEASKVVDAELKKPVAQAVADVKKAAEMTTPRPDNGALDPPVPPAAGPPADSATTTDAKADLPENASATESSQPDDEKPRYDSWLPK